MMPRLTRSSHAVDFPSGWPEPDRPVPNHLFDGRTQFRTVCVLLDDDVPDGVRTAEWSKEALLEGLLQLDLVKCVRYADNGPHPSVPRRTNQFGSEYVPNWAVLGPPTSSPWDPRTLHIHTGDHTILSGIVGDLPERAIRDTNSGSYAHLDAAAAAERRRQDVVASMVAESVGADLHITGREYLLERQQQDRNPGGVTAVGVDDALALLGLYCRVQHRFLVCVPKDGPGGSFGMSRGLYFWVGARELLPSAWRWLTAVVRQSNAVGDNAVSVVAQAALQRVSRALQVRDALHLALNRPQTNDTADDVASLFEMVAMLLMGAVDATARVAHEVLALGDSRHRAGWQNPAWLSKVKGQSPELKELFPAVGNTTDALTILRACRNTVHAEGIRQLIMSSAATRDRTMIELPKDKASDLEAAFERLGGKARWGIEPVFQESLHADPGILAEQLLLHILGMLNRIMDTTPVERFEHANLQEVDSLPPECESFDTFGEMTRNSIRWQLGL